MNSPVTPRLNRESWPPPPEERFETGTCCEESGWTREAWKAYVRSDTIRDLDDILGQAQDLIEKIEMFLGTHGGEDPGAELLVKAGIPLPPRIVKYGTNIRGISDDLTGVRWAINEFVSKAEQMIVDPESYDVNGLAIEPESRKEEVA